MSMEYFRSCAFFLRLLQKIYSLDFSSFAFNLYFQLLSLPIHYLLPATYMLLRVSNQVGNEAPHMAGFYPPLHSNFHRIYKGASVKWLSECWFGKCKISLFWGWYIQSYPISWKKNSSLFVDFQQLTHY